MRLARLLVSEGRLAGRVCFLHPTVLFAAAPRAHEDALLHKPTVRQQKNYVGPLLAGWGVAAASPSSQGRACQQAPDQGGPPGSAAHF